MKYCKSCGAELLDEAVVCPKCGVVLDEIKAPLTKNKFAVAGFVLSIVAMFINMYAVPAVLGLVFSIIGLIQITKGSYKGKGLAVAGIIISVVAIGYDIVYYTVIEPAMEEFLNDLLESMQ